MSREGPNDVVNLICGFRSVTGGYGLYYTPDNGDRLGLRGSREFPRGTKEGVSP